MREVLTELTAIWCAGETAGVATVVRTTRSALRLPAVGYIGATGSRRTHDDRLARLRAAGLTETELARLASPIGLDLGARTPEQTAVSIAAEIISRCWGGGGRPLAQVEGRVHHDLTP